MRIPAVLGACLLCLIPLFAPSQQVSAPAPQSASITGVVTDIQNGSIPAATIVLDGPSPSDHATVTTAPDGLFVFKNLRSSIAYRLTIAANGFADWTSPPIILKPGEERDLGSVALSISVVQTTVTAMTSEQIATQEVKVEEKQRVFGAFPNFYVVYNSNPAPLPARLKYQLALRASIDPVNILATAAFAGFNQAGDTPDYQQGAKGYAQRFGAAYTDGFTDIMIGGAILPSLLHQDPRYFYQGTGTIKSRIRHALASPLICKGDDGRNQFNVSSIGGDLASAALSNLYYPPGNRGAALVFDNALISTAGRMANALAQEFLFRRFTPSAKKQH